MKSFSHSTLGFVAGALLLGSTNAVAGSNAPGVIPEGSVINAAIFSINVSEGFGATVNVHRVTAAWGESTVTWNSFAGAYDPAVIDSFTGNNGWQSADVTALVQGWVDGSVPNYGILIEQGLTSATTYRSSEDATPALRPELEIFFTPPGDVMQQIVIRRDGAVVDSVFDAYIHEIVPDYNGNWESIFTGNVAGSEKQSLLQFQITVEPGDTGGPGTGTPGYWKNHPEAWPVDSITIGGIVYTKDEAIAWMQTPVNGDKTKTMFAHLVCAKLNVIIGNESSCIDETISDADDWMALHPVGSGVEGKSAAWTEGAPLATLLDDYNNGLLCAPHMD